MYLFIYLFSIASLLFTLLTVQNFHSLYRITQNMLDSSLPLTFHFVSNQTLCWGVVVGTASLGTAELPWIHARNRSMPRAAKVSLPSRFYVEKGILSH